MKKKYPKELKRLGWLTLSVSVIALLFKIADILWRASDPYYRKILELLTLFKPSFSIIDMNFIVLGCAWIATLVCYRIGRYKTFWLTRACMLLIIVLSLVEMPMNQISIALDNNFAFGYLPLIVPPSISVFGTALSLVSLLGLELAAEGWIKVGKWQSAWDRQFKKSE